jgi:membrane protein
MAQAKEDRLVLLSAGVAFFGLLALVPGLVALVSVYGLVADPADVSRHVEDLLGAAPSEVQDFAEQQLRSVAAGAGGATGVGLAVSVVVALWSASSGMKQLVEALNATYDEQEGRGFVRVRGLALLLTIGAVLFVVVAVGVIAVVPALVPGPVALLRWPLLGAAFVAALAVLYRVAPSRDEPDWRWVTPGALVATALWLVASALFSIYVANFGSYNETYGSLGGIVVVMLWLFLTAASVLVGAELDAELERQTVADSTHGPDEPMGDREAYAADTVGPTAEEVALDRRRRRERASP